MTEEDDKYIYTKRRVYRLPGDAKGIPVEAPDRSDLARRWSGFCRDYASTLKQAQSAGLAPAACNPYADIDFSVADRERRHASKARSSRERDGFER